MLEHLRSYFVHYRAERYGVMAVIVLCMIFIAVGIIVPQLVSPVKPDPEVLEWYASINADPTKHESASFDPPDQDSVKKSLFIFDPNTLNDSGFSQLGFSEKEVKMLRKYLAAGATFREKDDFAKLYFMNEARFDSIRPYLLLPEKAEKPLKRYQTPEKSNVQWSDTARLAHFKYNPVIAELNSADTMELKKLPGIGSFYARRIVEYREELGGYFDLGQLLELWKMKPETIDRFADKVAIDHRLIVKLDVNSATAQTLSLHPYISFGLANKIVNYRESHGPFRDMDDLVEAGLLNEDLRLKLAAYLHF